jgi:hypothetical protein
MYIIQIFNISIYETRNAPPRSLRCGKAKAKLIPRDDFICTFLNPSLLVCLDRTLLCRPMILLLPTMPTTLTTTTLARIRLVALSIHSSEVSTSSRAVLAVHERTRVEQCRPMNLPNRHQRLRESPHRRLNIVQFHQRQRQQQPPPPPPLRHHQVILRRY